MSETTTNDLAGDFGEPVVKSDVVIPNDPLTGEPPAAPEPEAKPEPGKPAEPEKPAKAETPWYEKRLATQTAKIAAEARRADAAERALADFMARRGAQPTHEAPQEQPQGQQPAPQPKALTDADIERIVAERETARKAEEHTKAFNAECAKVADIGGKEFPDFSDALRTLWSVTEGLDDRGGMTPQAVSLIEAAIETEKAHQVLHYLGKNPDEAMKISAMTDAKRGVAIAKIAAKLEAPKPISKAPPPISPVGGSAQTESGAMGPKDPVKWMAWRDEQVKAAQGR
jgi:hypothetical protein